MRNFGETLLMMNLGEGVRGSCFCIILASLLEDWNYYKKLLQLKEFTHKNPWTPKRRKSTDLVVNTDPTGSASAHRMFVGPPIDRMQGWDTCRCALTAFIHSFIHPANIYWALTMCKGSAVNHTHILCPCDTNVHRGGGRQKGMWKPLSCAWPLALIRYSDPEGRYWCLNHLCSPGL